MKLACALLGALFMAVAVSPAIAQTYEEVTIFFLDRADAVPQPVVE